MMVEGIAVDDIITSLLGSFLIIFWTFRITAHVYGRPIQLCLQNIQSNFVYSTQKDLKAGPRISGTPVLV